MKHYLKFYYIIFLILNCQIAFTQNAHKQLREGDTYYRNGDFKLSEEKYKKADEMQPSERTRYNLGNAMYQQKRLEEATKQYESVAKQPNVSPDIRAKALHNLGNIQYQQKDYQKAVESYRNALKINPKDVNTKRNLAIAQKHLQPPPPSSQQQQQQQNNSNNQNKQNNNQPQPKQNPNENKEDAQNNGSENKGQQLPQSNNENTPSSQQPLNHDELRQMLQIMENEEKKVQQRLQKGKPKPNRSAKDW